LAWNKLFPALFSLFKQGQFAEVYIVGFRVEVWLMTSFVRCDGRGCSKRTTQNGRLLEMYIINKAISMGHWL